VLQDREDRRPGASARPFEPCPTTVSPSATEMRHSHRMRTRRAPRAQARIRSSCTPATPALCVRSGRTPRACDRRSARV